jgi:hypothetical protein
MNLPVSRTLKPFRQREALQQPELERLQLEQPEPEKTKKTHRLVVE